ncbi:MAG: hypothetical protein FJ298_04860 [Planctomycetes bacterium]|nr:hypothetical protein [Planctomycetota bacterium]
MSRCWRELDRRALAAREHIRGEALARANHGEALPYLPELDEFRLGPAEYHERIRRLRAMSSVPVSASLNGTTEGSWLGRARSMEEARASAPELNPYALEIDPRG